MRVWFIFFTIITLLLVFPISPGLTTINNPTPSFTSFAQFLFIEESQSPELPSALLDDDSFNELPFEQLRQALREEVEHGPKKGTYNFSDKKYNLLIR